MVAETTLEKIRLVMEETGCDEGEAQVALELSRYDVSRAIRTMGSLLRHINVVKGKCRITELQLYGLFLLIADVKSKFLLRLRCVFSYNPAVYETDLASHWVDFERKLYGFRLAEGSHQQLSQELEHLCYGRLKLEESKSFFDSLREAQMDSVEKTLKELMRSYFHHDDLGIASLREELNLEQYRQMQPRAGGNAADMLAPALGSHASNGTGKTLILQLSVAEDPEGLKAEDLMAGDVIHCQITDSRDIAQYLARLLGGKTDDATLSLPSTVEEIRQEHMRVTHQARFAPGIVGQATVGSKDRIHVVKRRDAAWWEKLIPWKT